MRTLILSLAAAGLVGCSGAALDAPLDATVAISPDTVSIGWAEEFNGAQDGIGALIWFDVYVSRSDTSIGEMPLERIEVEVSSNYGGIYLIPEEAVKLVDAPDTPDEVTSAADVESSCTDEDGNYDNSEEWCAWYYDTETAQFYQFGSDYADAEGYAPTYMVSETGDRGLLRVYAYADAMPTTVVAGETSFAEAQITASIGVDNAALVVEAL